MKTLLAKIEPREPLLGVHHYEIVLNVPEEVDQTNKRWCLDQLTRCLRESGVMDGVAVYNELWTSSGHIYPDAVMPLVIQAWVFGDHPVRPVARIVAFRDEGGVFTNRAHIWDVTPGLINAIMCFYWSLYTDNAPFNEYPYREGVNRAWAGGPRDNPYNISIIGVQARTICPECMSDLSTYGWCQRAFCQGGLQGVRQTMSGVAPAPVAGTADLTPPVAPPTVTEFVPGEWEKDER